MEYRSDRAELKHWEITEDGYLQFLAPIAREGYLIYHDASGVRREFVSAATLKKTAHSFAKKPITIGHPATPLNAKNAKQHAVGWTANEARLGDDGILWLSGTVFDQDAIDSISSGQTKEISCGYSAKIVDRGDGIFEQVNRRGNHVAAVARGRAGAEVSFKLDSGEESLISQGFDASPPLIKKASQSRSRKEQMTYTANLDGISIELNSMDEAKHVKAIDADLARLRLGVEKAAEQARSDSASIAELNDRITSLSADLLASQAKADSIQDKFDALSLDRSVEIESRQDGDNVDIESILAKHLPERMALWDEVLPIFRSDSEDFVPDYLMSPTEIKVAYLRHARPDLGDRLDSLDMNDDRSVGAIDGMYAAFNPRMNTQRSKKSANRVDALLATLRGDRSVEPDRLDSVPSMDKIRSAYESAYRGGAN